MKKLVILTGAGMSVESGLSTFRDSGGMWDNYRVEDVATPGGFARNPEMVNNFYNQMRRKLQTIRPCRGHELLAELENDFDVTIITQNVDDLHERAGSRHVIHLHGELTKVTSSREPNNPNYIRTLKPEEWEVKSTDKAPDGSRLRPFIVWFEEPVPKIEEAIDITSRADIFVIIGTSLVVYPAASLIRFVPANAPVYLIDPKPVKGYRPQGTITQIQKSATPGLEELIPLLKK